MPVKIVKCVLHDENTSAPCAFSDAPRKNASLFLMLDAFDSAASFGRALFYVHDITVILRYFFEENDRYGEGILLAKIFDGIDEVKYNVVIYYHQLCKTSIRMPLQRTEIKFIPRNTLSFRLFLLCFFFFFHPPLFRNLIDRTGRILGQGTPESVSDRVASSRIVLPNTECSNREAHMMYDTHYLRCKYFL